MTLQRSCATLLCFPDILKMAARRRDPPMGVPELKFMITTMDQMQYETTGLVLHRNQHKDEVVRVVSEGLRKQFGITRSKAQIVKKWGDLKSKSPARLQELRREIRSDAKTHRRRHEASHTASDIAVPSGSTAQQPKAKTQRRRRVYQAFDTDSDPELPSVPTDPKATTQRRSHEASHPASHVRAPSGSTAQQPKAKTKRRSHEASHPASHVRAPSGSTAEQPKAKTQRRSHEASHPASHVRAPSGSTAEQPKAKKQRSHPEASQSPQYWPPDALPENMTPDEVLPPAGSVTIVDVKARIERLCVTLAQIQEQQNLAIGELIKIKDMCQLLEAGQ
ncbi:serine/arginine repetitive matrix protein 2-like [Ranitomeya imitator]|uniref:serine/arginine repetitive matrix protein 2-like n=1 Tax=Ranitomeya imitator TaxID=111125 RepID=UPI0037E92C7A